MTQPVLRVRILLWWAFCCCFAGAFAVSAHADGPTLTAVFGMAGRYRPGAWCPVTISVNNAGGNSIPGQVQVLAATDQNRSGSGPSGNSALGAALFARPVTVSANPALQTFQIYTRGLDPGRDSITVQIVEGRSRGDGRILAQANTQDTKTSQAITGTPVSDNDPMLVGFGGDPGAFTYLSGQKLTLAHLPGVSSLQNAANPLFFQQQRMSNGGVTPTVQVAETQGTDLPDKAAGYGGVDAFLLRSDAPLDALTEAQTEALKGWIASGGHLVVCGGVDASRFASSFFNGLLPATVGAARPAVTLPGAGPVGLLALTPKPFPGVRTLSSTPDGTPLVVTGPYGAGRVTFTAYDPTAKGFQSAAFDGPGLWRTLLTGGSSSSSALLPHVVAREENYHPNYYGYSGPSQLLSDAVMRGPSLDAPGTEVIGLFLLVYLIALVPANYLILKRLDRKELAWVTIPLLVLLFAVGTFGVGYAAKGGTVFVNRAALVEASAGRREAGVYAELGLFSPHRTSYDLILPGANALAAIPNPGFSYGYRGGSNADTQTYGLTKFVQTPEGTSLLDTSVNMWAMRAFDVQATEDLGGTLDSTLSEQSVSAPVGAFASRIAGTVTNHLSHPLRGCVLLYHGQWQTLGDLPVGAGVPVSDTAFTSGAAQAGSLSRLPLGTPAARTDAQSDIHARMRSSLADYARSLGGQNTNNYYNGGPIQAPAVYEPAPGEALLLGWSDDPALAGPSPRVDGQIVKENHVSLVIVHLPIKGARIVAAAPPFAPPIATRMMRPLRYPAQQRIASQTVQFGTTTRTVPDYRQAMEAHNLARARQSLGRVSRFHGIVTQVYQDPQNQTLVLNFDPQYTHALTAVLTFRGYSRFPNMQSLRGREVLISGPLLQYQDKVAVMLSQPSQVQIVQ